MDMFCMKVYVVSARVCTMNLCCFVYMYEKCCICLDGPREDKL